jgi:hypothetical protein
MAPNPICDMNLLLYIRIMGFYLIIASLVAVLGLWFYYEYRLRKKQNLNFQNSLDDETLYIDGVPVALDELDDLVNGDPDEGVKFQWDTMFKEDLMKFEGEFLIPGLPLNEERRQSIDDAFLYVLELFGDELINKPILTRDHPIFPIEINDTSEIIPLAHKIAEVMDIDPSLLEIGFFEGAKPVDPASIDSANKEVSAAGLYYGKNENGKYQVDFDDTIHVDVERITATIAHEFSHIKLLGEGRMEENSEELTDMLPLFYGFGLFNSEMVLTFKRESNGLQNSWQSNTLGYLSFADWGYLFALYMYKRNEMEPEWFKYLNKTVSKDCKLALDFILANPDKVLQTSTKS